MSGQQRHPQFARIATLVAIGALGLAACGGDDDATGAVAEPAVTEPAAASEADAPAFGLVSPQQALDLSNDPAIVVIDVRTPEEFAEGYIDGADMIDFYADTFADDIAALDPDSTYLLYCRSGNRSGQTATMMQQLGFENVYDMEGGVVAYGEQGLPLVR
jgi:rhodanese-related sulfurtransferase